MRLVVPCLPRASNIKKSLVDLPVQLGSRVSKARTHISKVRDARVIMGMQDVRTCSYSCYSTTPALVDHLQYTATVPGDPIGWCCTVDHAQYGRTIRQDILYVVEGITCFF
jgi:hypothetical protein